jgi:hypothetical protein
MDIALLKLRIEQDKDVGFNNLARLLESMSITCFRALDIADLKSKQQIKVNFPAIDSSDDDKDGGIALQVTSVADAKKIRDTIAAFEKKDATGKSIKDGYAKLYILGFCKASKTAKVPPYCEVIDPSFLVTRLIDADDENKIQMVLDSVRRQTNYPSLHPYSDIECLKIMLVGIGRNAIRHRMEAEGDVKKMTAGLNEVSELIGKGSINSKIKSKALSEIQDPKIQKFLLGVLNSIGKITAIVHTASRDDGFVYLNDKNMESIDKQKHAITKSAMQIAAAYGIDMPLEMHESD